MAAAISRPVPTRRSPNVSEQTLDLRRLRIYRNSNSRAGLIEVTYRSFILRAALGLLTTILAPLLLTGRAPTQNTPPPSSRAISLVRRARTPDSTR